MGLYEFLWIRQEVKIIKPLTQNMETSDSSLCFHTAKLQSQLLLQSVGVSSPSDKAFMFHIYSSSPPAGIQEEPLSSQQHSVPQVIRVNVPEALALTVPDTFTVSWHFLALDAHFSVHIQNKKRFSEQEHLTSQTAAERVALSFW